jgi:polysaccharide export outer membrane protein
LLKKQSFPRNIYGIRVGLGRPGIAKRRRFAERDGTSRLRWRLTVSEGKDSIVTATMKRLTAILTLLVSLSGCGSGGTNGALLATNAPGTGDGEQYVIGAGDALQVFVWGHDDLSTSVAVRPDGNISTPLVEDMQAAGRTPTELARAIEEVLTEFVRSPTVTIIIQQFVGEYDRQIRVVGQATEPMSLNYRAGMSLLDVMIEVGGLSEFASGNKAKIVRNDNGNEVVINVRIKDLLNRGDMNQNVRMQPGDVLIIPESVF